MTISGKCIIVTGASSGFGALLGRKLAARGAKVALFARRKELLEVIASEIRAKGGIAFPFQCDITEPGQVEAAVRDAVAAMGSLDVLVNNAGILRKSPLEKLELTDIRAQFDTNVFGTVSCTKAVLPFLLEKSKGQIINISSIAGWLGPTEWSVYAATKAAMTRMSQSWRWELASKGILVTTVYPYYAETDHVGEPGSDLIRERFPFTPIQNTENVSNAIVNAIDRPKRDVYVPNHLRFWFLFPPVAPGLVDYLARKFPFGWPKGYKTKLGKKSSSR